MFYISIPSGYLDTPIECSQTASMLAALDDASALNRVADLLRAARELALDALRRTATPDGDEGLEDAAEKLDDLEGLLRQRCNRIHDGVRAGDL